MRDGYRRALSLGAAIAIALPATGASARPKVIPIEAGQPGPVSEAEARRALAAVAPELADVELVLRRRQGRPGASTIFSFAQANQGVRVVGRGAGLALDGEGRPRFAVIDVARELPSSEPLVSEKEAQALASRMLGGEARVRLGYYPLPSGARLGWLTDRLDRRARPDRAEALVLDARTGRTMLRFPIVRHAKLGRVYLDNPVVTPTLSQVTMAVPDGATQLLSPRLRATNCIDHHDTINVSSDPDNPFEMHLCHVEPTAFADAQLDFPQLPTSDLDPEDSFAELSLFHHSERAYQQFLSMGMSELDSKPLSLVANYRLSVEQLTCNFSGAPDPGTPLQSYDNAFFTPGDPYFEQLYGVSGGGLWFGQGESLDYSYDGEVVYHEFAHAVVDHTLKLVPTWQADAQGMVDASAAMNEGLADYFSSVITGDPSLGEYVAQMGGSLRSVDNAATCPAGLSGESHHDSSFFSGALWSVRSSLAPSLRTVFDQALFDAMATSPSGDLGFEDLAKIFSTSVAASPLGPAVAQQLDQEMLSRGVLPSCQRVLEYQGFPVSPDGEQGVFYFVVPGTVYSPVPSPPFMPGAVQLHAAVPPASSVTVTAQAFLDADPCALVVPESLQVLVRFGSSPITFSYAPSFSHDGDALVSFQQGFDGLLSAQVPVPAGASSLYLMLVNADQPTGYVWGVDLAFEPLGAGGAAGTAGAGGAPAGGAPGAGAGGSAAGAGKSGAPSGGQAGAGAQGGASPGGFGGVSEGGAPSGGKGGNGPGPSGQTGSPGGAGGAVAPGAGKPLGEPRAAAQDGLEAADGCALQAAGASGSTRPLLTALVAALVGRRARRRRSSVAP